MHQVPGLFISDSDGRGRGVFTGLPLHKGDMIEICPLIIIPADQSDLINKTIIYDYYFVCPGNDGRLCLALGYGSLYNHNDRPNAKVEFDMDESLLRIICTASIKAGDEICIDYRGGLKDAPDLWFEPR